MANQSPELSRDILLERINQIFQGSVKPSTNAIGIELEVFPFQKANEKLDVLVDIENEYRSGLCDLLKNEAAASDQLRFLAKEAGVNQFQMKGGGFITFEPGGQVEFSSAAQPSLRSVFTEVKENIDILYQILSPASVWFFHGGMTPWHGVEEVGLKNTKSRYQAMDKYFQSIGSYGQQMMRLTTSIQVNLDFGSPEVARERWTAGYLMVPILTAIFGNTPYFNNRPTGVKSYRSIIWQNLDKSRTGLPFPVSENPLEGDPRQQYLDFALNANAVFLPDQSGTRSFQVIDYSFRKWLESGYNGFFPGKKDWDDHLTLLFPEVRPKGFLEFRSFDGQSEAWWSIPALLLASIIYDDTATRRVIDLLSPHKNALNKMLLTAAKTGVDTFKEIARQVFEIGLESGGYSIDEGLHSFMERFYQTYTFKGINPSDMLLDQFPNQAPSPIEFLDFEKRLLDQANPPEYARFSHVGPSDDRNDFSLTHPALPDSQTGAAKSEPCTCC